jgi:predicted MFS family arabinose efflux permease
MNSLTSAEQDIQQKSLPVSVIRRGFATRTSKFSLLCEGISLNQNNLPCTSRRECVSTRWHVVCYQNGASRERRIRFTADGISWGLRISTTSRKQVSNPVLADERQRPSLGVTTTVSPPDSVFGRGELWSMSAIAFLVFYSNSMIAPLIPALAREFGVRPFDLKWLMPGFSLLYGIATLIYGALSDRFARYPVLKVLLCLAALTTFSLSFATNARQLVLLRLLTGAGTGGIATIALSIVGDRYPYVVQGRPMGQMFGAIAAGMGLGSSLGPLLVPLLGWRNEVRILAFGFGAAAYWVTRHLKSEALQRTAKDPLSAYALEYLCIFNAPRGGRTLAFIFANGAFHGGIFAWLAVLIAGSYRLSEIGIGLVLAGYGIPDLLFGVVIGSWGDRYGRRYVVPMGFFWASICALLLALRSTPLISALIITALSVGFDATHPLMSSITTSIDPKRRGQVTGLATFANFVGMAIGALLFRRLMVPHFSVALVSFALFEFVAGVFALYAFRAETPAAG